MRNQSKLKRGRKKKNNEPEKQINRIEKTAEMEQKKTAKERTRKIGTKEQEK
jgi:hypothetical protein